MRWIAFLAMLLPFALSASEDSLKTVRPVNSAYMVGFGSAVTADTYLAPVDYDGLQLFFSYQRAQAMRFNPEKWVMKLGVDLRGERTLNSRRTGTFYYAGVEASWQMVHRWKLPAGFSVGTGGSVSLVLGALADMSNGNNPVSARAAVDLGAAGYAAWNGRWGRLPVTMRYNIQMPVTGAFFSPEYGELYYEIGLGNRKGLAHCAWWGNYFRMNNSVDIDMHFSNTTLRVGYRCDIFTTGVNHLITRSFRHAAVIGVCQDWMSLRQRSTLTPMARVISSNY